MIRIGLDIGSTTLKCIVLDEDGQVLHQQYNRHFSQIGPKTKELLEQLAQRWPQAAIAISGSAGMGLANGLDVNFVQEVYATRKAVQQRLPETDVVIELGGEDAKIIFLSNGTDVCMNGTCAGGTGAFIDQMASLLQISQDEMNALAKNARRIYPIASRCGVFAKSDIQPLLNQGATKEDVSASIFSAVVSQTIAGLAHGRPIQGNVTYLGGPLTFFSQLRKAFDDQLHLKGTCPDLSLYFVAYGTALLADQEQDLESLALRVEDAMRQSQYDALPPLFETKEEYAAFCARHPKEQPAFLEPTDKPLNLYVGIDAGSTTIKAAALNEKGDIIFWQYLPNAGNPVPLVKKFLETLYERYPQANVLASAATGYGEELIKAAFHVDFGVVETIAHFTAAKAFDPEVDFIIDIGGQDIKCFQIRNGAIDSLFLNEACSSGCGSFLQTFAQALGYDMETFSKRALEGRIPVDLGSRCTVFMNSSVKQAQKDGAALENIAAGLAVSVVKNALYKVIRAKDGQKLGDHILVQGGTFLNDAVLRAFELELGQEVIRPNVSGLMGAYGAALYAKETGLTQSALLKKAELETFQHRMQPTVCQGCTNHCHLTVNTFASGKPYIAGNQCERPVTGFAHKEGRNMFAFKRSLLERYGSQEGKMTLGIPMVLGMWELLPFWHTLLKELGYGLVVSGPSSKTLYQMGQGSICSDTACYPAKLAHGHAADLAAKGADALFWPCLSYNIDEHKADSHYNCPVVAYYPEVIASVQEDVIPVWKPYLGIHRKKEFPLKFKQAMEEYGQNLSVAKVKAAADKAWQALAEHEAAIEAQGKLWLEQAKAENKPIIILCGRPYHADKEICHGIDEYIVSQGYTLICEDALRPMTEKADADVLNQWTYHARMYSAAQWLAKQDYPKMALVQLVSFGCGLDAVTADEVRAIAEASGRLYAQIKIDEITNLGAVKIRLRSLFAAMEQKESEA